MRIHHLPVWISKNSFSSAFISYEGYSTGQMELNKYKRRDFIIKIETTICEENLKT